ncbi:MAG: hypothetical protein D9V47_15165 [Clostridia bacterium]|nr:MAG: hypothetical protein D9V47_15165 [Clostridia bacterium]
MSRKVTLGLFEGTTLAIMGMRLRFSAPVFPGDTIYCKLVVEESRDLGRPDRGEILLRADMLNQNQVIVQQMWTNVVLRRKPQGAQA